MSQTEIVLVLLHIVAPFEDKLSQIEIVLFLPQIVAPFEDKRSQIMFYFLCRILLRDLVYAAERHVEGKKQ